MGLYQPLCKYQTYKVETKRYEFSFHRVTRLQKSFIFKNPMKHVDRYLVLQVLQHVPELMLHF